MLYKAHTKDENLCLGSFLQGKIEVSYEKIVRRFGNPSFPNGDEYKVDVEWLIMDTNTNELITIYNYKDGKNYLKEEGLDKEEITDWHIGGTTSTTVKILLDEFKKWL